MTTQTERPDLRPVDFVIIGSGAGGAPMALELCRAGFKVVLLEKGAWYKQEDFVHDEILNSRRNMFMPFPWDEPHLWRAGAQAPYSRTNEAWTANCVGGGTVHMSGYFYRLKPVDFRQKTELGAPAGSNVVDWPITYADLAPFYDKAERELGVSGNAVPHPFLEPRSGNYPLPPLAEHPVVGDIERAAKSFGWHAIPTARGIATTPRDGRGACVYCALCGSYGCETGAKSSTLAALLPQALATGNLELRPHSMAKELRLDDKGLVKSVVYLDQQGQEQEQAARNVVVSCTAVESARLLLNSKSARFPNGLANDSGLVGKNLLFSSFGQSKATFSTTRKGELPWLESTLPFVNRSLQDFYVMPDDTQGFRKGGTLGFMWQHPNPIFAAVNLAKKGEEGVFGKALKDRLRAYRDSRILEFEIYGEFLSNDATSVGVDPNVKDKYGLPVAAITITRHPTDFVMTKFLVERGEDVLGAMKPDAVTRVGTAGETTILQGGTARFGKDPAHSVLDPFCRSHAVKNLYVVDGSFLPTSGGVPLTLTIAANSFRVADHVVKTTKKGA
jgi:choline dehydrogenase-like flavoprotein